MPFALGIPEILERILSFLPLQNRQDAARLVCKEWFVICKDLIPVSYTWILRLNPNNYAHSDNSNTSNNKNGNGHTIQELISFAHNITIQVDDVTLLRQPSQQLLASWTIMMDMLSTMTRDYGQQRVQPRLRSLYLREGVLGNFDLQLSQLPLLNTLTTLQIDRIVEWDIIHLFPILKACPHLEELSIKPTSLAETLNRSTYPSIHPSRAITASQEHDIIHGDKALPILPRLRTCSLYSPIITLLALAYFLQAVPQLSKLILIRCSHHVRQSQESNLHVYADNHVNHSISIIRLVGTHCPGLKTFCFSMCRSFTHMLDSQELMTLLDTFPHLEEYNFPAQEISPTLFKTFSAAVANRITTLNLLPMARQTYSTRAIPLRNILCTFEHLVHLRAPTVEYLLDDMDLNDIRGQLQKLWIKKHGLVDATSRSHPRIAQDDPAVARQYVWVCRGLRTLHMKVDYHGTDCDFSELSLIVFGFLSRMCPRLQELSLKRRTLDLSLQGGLCLLTRLQELERARIITHHYPQMDERDLLWIPSTPLSTWDRLYYPLLRHSTCKDLQAQYKGISPDKTTGSKIVERGRELGMDLSKVGYPEDLLDWMEERYGTTIPGEGDSSSFCRSLQLPNLQSFSVECREKKDKKATAAQKLEEVVAKVRPNVHFRVCEEHKDAFYETTLKYW